MLNNIFIFIAALFMVIKGATLAANYAAILAENYRLSKYTIGFIIVAIISILPETFIALNSAIEGIPAFGLGVLFGSNIADLTLIFAIIILISRRRGLKIESKILKNHAVYPLILLFPLILGLDAHYSRIDGIALTLVGAIFYYIALKNGTDGALPTTDGHNRYKTLFYLVLGMVILLIGSHFTVTSAIAIAHYIGINPVLIGMIFVGLGTTMPELFFSLKAAKKGEDSLLIGDLLGTVLADATVVVGILALVSPFSFPINTIYITGMFMVVAAFILFLCMRTGKKLSKAEAYMLLILWVVFMVVEFIINS